MGRTRTTAGPDGEIGVIEVGDAAVGEDVFAVSSAEAVAFDGLPYSQHAYVELRVFGEDLVGDPTGTVEAFRSGG